MKNIKISINNIVSFATLDFVLFRSIKLLAYLIPKFLSMLDLLLWKEFVCECLLKILYQGNN